MSIPNTPDPWPDEGGHCSGGSAMTDVGTSWAVALCPMKDTVVAATVLPEVSVNASTGTASVWFRGDTMRYGSVITAVCSRRMRIAAAVAGMNTGVATEGIWRARGAARAERKICSEKKRVSVLAVRVEEV